MMMMSKWCSRLPSQNHLALKNETKFPELQSRRKKKLTPFQVTVFSCLHALHQATPSNNPNPPDESTSQMNGVGGKCASSHKLVYFFHLLSGGWPSTRRLPTSAQFVLKTVPPLSCIDLLMARLASSSPCSYMLLKKESILLLLSSSS